MAFCRQCGAKNEGTKFCPECGASQDAGQVVTTPARARPPATVPDKEVVRFEQNGDVKLHVNSVAEAKIALKQLRLRKREIGTAMKSIMEQQREIRAAYTDKVRHRGSKIRGGGGVGRFIRAVQTSSRDADRKNLAKNLAPYEERRTQLERMASVIDRAIIQIENYIAQNS